MRRKIRFYKLLLAEICETLCTICLDRSLQVRSYNLDAGKYRELYMSHFHRLKDFSSKLREDKE